VRESCDTSAAGIENCLICNELASAIGSIPAAKGVWHAVCIYFTPAAAVSGGLFPADREDSYGSPRADLVKPGSGTGRPGAHLFKILISRGEGGLVWWLAVFVVRS
jgi:hypothetical protein